MGLRRLNYYRARKKAFIILTHLALLIAAFAIAFPVIFALIKSTQSTAQVFSYPPKFTIGRSALENYAVAWNDYNLGRLMLNTFIVALSLIHI